MRTIADMLIGLEELTFKVALCTTIEDLGFNALWVKGLEAWMGRGLKVGLIEIMSYYDWHNLQKSQTKDLAKQLSERLTAG